MTTIYHHVIDPIIIVSYWSDSIYAIWFYLYQYIYNKINDFNLEIKANHILKSAKILVHLM